jgi:hypothetical protein
MARAGSSSSTESSSRNDVHRRAKALRGRSCGLLLLLATVLLPQLPSSSCRPEHCDGLDEMTSEHIARIVLEREDLVGSHTLATQVPTLVPGTGLTRSGGVGLHIPHILLSAMIFSHAQVHLAALDGSQLARFPMLEQLVSQACSGAHDDEPDARDSLEDDGVWMEDPDRSLYRFFCEDRALYRFFCEDRAFSRRGH